MADRVAPAPSSASASGPRNPGSRRASRDSRSSSTSWFRRLRSSTTRPRKRSASGVRPPTTDVPPPNGTTATWLSAHRCSTARTSSWEPGKRTRSGAGSGPRLSPPADPRSICRARGGPGSHDQRRRALHRPARSASREARRQSHRRERELVKIRPGALALDPEPVAEQGLNRFRKGRAWAGSPQPDHESSVRGGAIA